MRISGAKQLQRLMRELPGRVDAKVNRRAVNLAGTPIVQACRAEAPEDEGDLKKSLIKKVTNRQMSANVVIGADEDYTGGSEGAIKKPANYDHLVEYGHITADGATTAPNPFMQRGWDNSIDAAQAKYEQTLVEGLQKEAEKLGGR